MIAFVLKFVTGFLDGIVALWKHPVGRWVLVILVFGFGLFLYVQHEKSVSYREGNRAGIVQDSLRSQRLIDRLIAARVVADSTYEARLDSLPAVVVRYRDRAVADTSGLDSLRRFYERDREAFIREYSAMSLPAHLPVDTTILSADSVEVRLRADVFYTPPFRTFDATFYPSPIVTQRWLIRRGYIIPPDTVDLRYSWSAELILGYAHAVRVSPALWWKSYGVGVDLERGFSPVYRVGWRLQW